ncbi:MAG: fasciclin domain-containing protein [Mycolicibacterium cosmeticum]|nr:fasciclin domain-containing protein [Mycolicibacterium cosmeticum]
MQARTGKLIGGVVASAAIALSAAVTAHADPTTPTAPVPVPQGSACDAGVKAVASGPGSLLGLSTAGSSAALASIPEISTFSQAISGQLNPAVNVSSVLDNGPYVVFAPSNDAFAKLDPAELEAIKADPVKLTALVYYHMVLGILGPDDIHGTMYTQQGKPVVVKGKGGDITVNDAKVTCAGIKTANARIYILDTVLDPALAPEGVTATATTTSTSSTETATTTPAAPATETPVTVTSTTTTVAPPR